MVLKVISISITETENHLRIISGKRPGSQPGGPAKHRPCFRRGTERTGRHFVRPQDELQLKIEFGTCHQLDKLSRHLTVGARGYESTKLRKSKGTKRHSEL